MDRNIDGAARDVQAAINAAASDLPIDLPGPPTWRKVNPADSPIMVLAMTSDTLPPATIFQYADEIVGQRLSQVEGVSQVGISGSEKSAVNVLVNPTALASTGYSLEEVRAMLGQVNVDFSSHKHPVRARMTLTAGSDKVFRVDRRFWIG